MGGPSAKRELHKVTHPSTAQTRQWATVWTHPRCCSSSHSPTPGDVAVTSELQQAAPGTGAKWLQGKTAPVGRGASAWVLSLVLLTEPESTPQPLTLCPTSPRGRPVWRCAHGLDCLSPVTFQPLRALKKSVCCGHQRPVLTASPIKYPCSKLNSVCLPLVRKRSLLKKKKTLNEYEVFVLLLSSTAFVKA